MRGLRADGTSASPIPEEEFERQFCQANHLNYSEYLDMPQDVVTRWAYMAGKVNAKIAELRRDPDSADVSAGGATVHFNDVD